MRLKGYGKRFLVLLASLGSPAYSLTGINPDGSLNRGVISDSYMEGDFNIVREACEAFRKGHYPATHDDSVFVYKHLSVIYASDSASREKAESYMYTLLGLAPDIDLLDLYISNKIEAVFNKVKSDYQRMRKLKLAKAEAGAGPAAGNAAPPTGMAAAPRMGTAPPKAPQSEAPPAVKRKPPSEPTHRKSHSAYYWVGGLVLGGGAAIAAYYLMFNEPARETRDYPLDLNTGSASGN